jgi:hypothetical protein
MLDRKWYSAQCLANHEIPWASRVEAQILTPLRRSWSTTAFKIVVSSATVAAVSSYFDVLAFVVPLIISQPREQWWLTLSEKKKHNDVLINLDTPCTMAAVGIAHLVGRETH